MKNGIRNKVITAVITAVVVGMIPGSIWLHNAWGDDRYVLKREAVIAMIAAIDNALFEADQELTFAKTEEEKAKFEARVNYYDRQKEALTKQLDDS